MSTSDNTKVQYLKTFLSLIKKCGSEDLDKIYEYIIESKAKPNTRLNYLNTLIGLKKSDPTLITGDLSKFIEMRDKLKTEVEGGRKVSNVSENQKKVLDAVNLQNLEEFAKDLEVNKDRSLRDLENYLLIKMMINYPLRNDLQEVYLTNVKRDLAKDENILYIPKTRGNAVLSLKHYKTSKTHGNIEITFDTSLTNDLKKLAKIDPERQYLFQTKDKKPMSSSNFTHRLNTLFKNQFGMPFSSTLIRKIYLTSKYKPVTDEMKTDAQIMGHSLATQRENYIRNDTK